MVKYTLQRVLRQKFIPLPITHYPLPITYYPLPIIMLPIKKVVLFKHGVGHFEREGQVNGDTSIDLQFRASEMNDVLKSLTALDLDDGVITSISYESTLPIEEQLKDIAIQVPEKSALKGLLSQLQGAHVAIDIGQKNCHWRCYWD
ncbi:conserved hypothetical protein [Beggiatoa sp. PS]|nr:conserved hypothetical protein [Beggiatoa sp. PS]